MAHSSSSALHLVEPTAPWSAADPGPTEEQFKEFWTSVKNYHRQVHSRLPRHFPPYIWTTRTKSARSIKTLLSVLTAPVWYDVLQTQFREDIANEPDQQEQAEDELSPRTRSECCIDAWRRGSNPEIRKWKDAKEVVDHHIGWLDDAYEDKSLRWTAVMRKGLPSPGEKPDQGSDHPQTDELNDPQPVPAIFPTKIYVPTSVEVKKSINFHNKQRNVDLAKQTNAKNFAFVECLLDMSVDMLVDLLLQKYSGIPPQLEDPLHPCREMDIANGMMGKNLMQPLKECVWRVCNSGSVGPLYPPVPGEDVTRNARGRQQQLKDSNIANILAEGKVVDDSEDSSLRVVYDTEDFHFIRVAEDIGNLEDAPAIKVSPKQIVTMADQKEMWSSNVLDAVAATVLQSSKRKGSTFLVTSEFCWRWLRPTNTDGFVQHLRPKLQKYDPQLIAFLITLKQNLHVVTVVAFKRSKTIQVFDPAYDSSTRLVTELNSEVSRYLMAIRELLDAVELAAGNTRVWMTEDNAPSTWPNGDYFYQSIPHVIPLQDKFGWMPLAIGFLEYISDYETFNPDAVDLTIHDFNNLRNFNAVYRMFRMLKEDGKTLSQTVLPEPSRTCVMNCHSHRLYKPASVAS